MLDPVLHACVECLPTGKLGDSTGKPWKAKLVDQCLGSMPMDEAALRQQQKFQEDSLWLCSARAILRNGRHDHVMMMMMMMVMMIMMMMKPRNMASSR